MDVRVEVTTYVVTVVPDTYPEWSTWSLTVEQGGPGRWAVTRGQMVFSKSQARKRIPMPVYEPRPSSRSDHFKDVYRFPLDEALELAKALAPKIMVNGVTGPGYMAWYDARQSERAEQA